MESVYKVSVADLFGGCFVSILSLICIVLTLYYEHEKFILVGYFACYLLSMYYYGHYFWEYLMEE